MLLLSSADFFQKILSGALSECQIVWVQTRNNILSKLFAKVISRQQKLLLARKELIKGSEIYSIQALYLSLIAILIVQNNEEFFILGFQFLGH